MLGGVSTNRNAMMVVSYRMRTLIALITLALGQSVFAQQSVQITLEQGTPAEAQTREQLQRLLKTYDLSPWIYTTSVVNR